MKLYIQEKLLSFRDKFSIKDELGKDRYFVEGELLSIGRKLHIKNVAGAEVALVVQKIWTFFPKFKIFVNGAEVAEITKKLTFFRPQYSILPNGWLITGDFFEHDYKITRGTDIVAVIHKRWISLEDYFEIDITNDFDPVLVISAVLAIDSVLGADTRNQHH